MKSLLFKTGETTDSKIGTEINPKDQGNTAIDTGIVTFARSDICVNDICAK